MADRLPKKPDPRDHFRHDVLIPGDDGLPSEVAWAYPDEVSSFERFTRELALIAGIVRPHESPAARGTRAAILVDYESTSETENVIPNVLDRRSCPDNDCGICPNRQLRGVVDIMRLFPSLLDCTRLFLFSRWVPGPLSRFLLAQIGVELTHVPLGFIPPVALSTNQWYTIWFGTRRQADEFQRRVWAPTISSKELR